MIANERLQQQTPDGFGFSTHSSLPFANYLEAGIVKICKVDGCDRKHNGYGYCRKHLRQIKKYGKIMDEEYEKRKNLICKVDGCDRKHCTFGYCRSHSNQFKKYGYIKRIKINQIIKRDPICTVEGCNKKHNGGGYCAAHLSQFKKYGKIISEKIRLKRKYTHKDKCLVDGCENAIYGNQYCLRHYTQIRQNGKILKRTKFDQNKIVIHKDYAKIEIYKKNEPIVYAKIDLEDVEKVKRCKWCLCHGYVITSYPIRINLADFLMNFKGNHKVMVDHISRDKLDNRKNNLRVVTAQQNCFNNLVQQKEDCGVIFNEKTKKWRVMIGNKKIYFTMGYFKDKEEAIKIRKQTEEKIKKVVFDNKPKRISILIASFNSSDLTIRLIESIFKHCNLDNNDTEIIICEDGGRKEEYSKIKEYLIKKIKESDFKLADTFIIFRNEKNIGLGATMNKLHERVRAKFIIKIDSDTTIIHKNFFDKLAKFLDEDKDLGLVTCKTDNIGQPLQWIRIPDCFETDEQIEEFMANSDKKELSYHNKKEEAYSGMMFMYRREDIEKYNIKYCTKTRFLVEDNIFYLDVLRKMKKECAIANKLFIRHTTNASQGKLFDSEETLRNRILAKEIWDKEEL